MKENSHREKGGAELLPVMIKRARGFNPTSGIGSTWSAETKKTERSATWRVPVLPLLAEDTDFVYRDYCPPSYEASSLAVRPARSLTLRLRSGEAARKLFLIPSCYLAA